MQLSYNYEQSSVDAFMKSIEKVQADLLKRIEKELQKNFTFTANRLEEGDIRTAILQLDNIVKTLDATGFNELIASAVVEQKQYLTLRAAEIKKAVGKVFGGVDQTALNAFLEAEFVSLQNIGESAMMAVKQELLQSILAGRTFDDAVLAIQGQVESKLTRYAETWYRTSFNEYTQRVEDTIAEQIGFGEDEDDIWVFYGAPLQKNSHEECRWALEKKEHFPYFTNDEKIAFENGTAYGGQPSPPRYNCQHSFGITNKTYQEYLDA